jgi:ABC-2 type transport system permease protein
VAELASIYLQLIGARVRAQWQYRTSLVLQVLASFLLSFTDLLVLLVIFNHLPRLSGWSLGEVAFLYGTAYVSFQLTDIAVGQLDQLPQAILTGQFDLLLIRPISTLLQVITLDFTLRRLGALGQGVLALVIAFSLVNIHWSAGRALLLASMPLCGMAIFASVWVIGATSTFWLVRTIEVLNAFTYGGNALTSYPMHIYGAWMRRLFVYVIPLAFVNYYPSLFILNKPDQLGAPAFVRFLGPPVAVAMLLVARIVWGIGVRHYRSTGS